jgi:thermitase
MLATLYPISFAVSLFSLIAWFYLQGQPAQSRLASKFFLGGFFVYLLSLAFSDAAFSTKLFVLFRDFMVLAIVSQCFNFFKKYKLAFFAMLFALYGAFHFFYWDMMVKSLAATPTTSAAVLESSALAPNGELFIQLNDNVKINDIQNTLNKYQATAMHPFTPASPDATDLDDWWMLDVPDAQKPQLAALITALEASNDLAYWEENELITVDPLEKAADEHTKREYGLNDPGVQYLWGFDAMQVDALYALLDAKKIRPTKKATIAILDTGIDGSHEDIKDNYKSLNTKYDDDPVSHGTHCAGIAGAVSNNGVGVASFSKDNSFVQVTSIKVLNRFGAGTQQGIVAGILEAADAGADVISMSLGGPGNAIRTRAYKKAVEYANGKGAIVVVAAGNSNRNAKDYSPANTPGVIAVAAVDTASNKAVFSNTVEDLKMGIAAPGVGIYSTVPKNGYATYSGTSMATPYVAGLLGLMKSIKPKLTTQEAYDILAKTGAETLSTEMTGKLIQPAKAIGAL